MGDDELGADVGVAVGSGVVVIVVTGLPHGLETSMELRQTLCYTKARLAADALTANAFTLCFA
jgi:hypothetical protein